MATRTVYLAVIQGCRQHPWHLEAKRWIVVLKCLICTWFLYVSMCFCSLVSSLLLRFVTLPWNLGFLPVLFRGKSSAGCCMIWRCATLWSPTSSDKSCIRCFKLKTLDLSWLGTFPANFATYFPAIPIIDLFFLNLSNWSKCFSPSPTFCLSSHHCLNVPEAPEASVASISRDLPVKKAKWRVQFRRSTWNTELQSNFIRFHTVPFVFEVLGTTCFDLGTAWSLSTGHRATWNAGMEGRGTAAPSKQTERFTQSAPPTSPSDFASFTCLFWKPFFAHLIFSQVLFLVCSDTSVTCVQFPPCLAVFRLFLWRCDQFPPPCVAWCNRPCQFRESLITWWEIYETWFADDWHCIYEMLRQDIKNRKARVSWRIQRIGCCDSWHIVWKYLEASASSIWLPIFITDPVGFVKINTSVCSCR